MSVREYSIKKFGRSYKISEHFKLGEFACADGGDKVLVSDELLAMLETLRAYGGFTISVTSGYRSPSWNKKVGGSSASYHCKGLAADCVIYKDGEAISPKLICCLAQTLGFKGIGRMRTAVHLDMAPRIYRGDELKDFSNNVGGDFYNYFGIAKKTIEDMKIKPKEDDDMKLHSWGAEPWKWAKDNGIMDGNRPEDALTREEAACIAERIYKLIKKEQNK